MLVRERRWSSSQRYQELKYCRISVSEHARVTDLFCVSQFRHETSCARACRPNIIHQCRGHIVKRAKAADLNPAIDLEAMVPRQVGNGVWNQTGRPGHQPQTRNCWTSSARFSTAPTSTPRAIGSCCRSPMAATSAANSRRTSPGLLAGGGFTLQAEQRNAPPSSAASRRRACSHGPAQTGNLLVLVGDSAVRGVIENASSNSALATGQFDNLLFRVSSIDGDQARAYRLQDQFVARLLNRCRPPTACAWQLGQDASGSIGQADDPRHCRRGLHQCDFVLGR